MKKKYYSFLILVCTLFLMLQITLLANDVLLPKHNVATTTTNISIFESGRTIINVRYTGYPDITSGAEIALKIEKKESSLMWKEIVSQSYITDDPYHVNKFEYPLSEMGIYRFTVTYTVSGTAGKNDVIHVREEKIYDENCPKMPLLRSSEDFDHDCTSADCCEFCYKIIGASASLSHKSNGTKKVYDDDYHYSGCINHTVSSSKCLQIIKEKHRFDENLICEDCGYKKLTFTERLDEENERIIVTFSADDEIRSYLSTEYLDENEYEHIYSDYKEFILWKTFQNTYIVYIPFEQCELFRKNGIQVQLHSQGKRFSVLIYPTLELE